METQAQAGNEPDITFGPYRLDRRRRRLFNGATQVPLTAKAFDTLEVLVSHAGQTVSKEELLKTVWRGTFVQEETLTQNISTIRKALGDTSDSARYVTTVPREGYRFVAPIEVHPLPEATPHAEVRPEPRRFGWRTYAAIGTVMLVSVIGLGRVVRNGSGEPQIAPMAFEVPEPEGSHFTTSGGALTLSPDGRVLAFLATDAAGRDNLWIRPLESVKRKQVPESIEASQPFWSADSKSIAFFSEGFLRSVDIAGGAVRAICELPDPQGVAGSWSEKGVILFAILGRGIFSVAAKGGTPLAVDPFGAGGCANCGWPSFLPDGRRFLFSVGSASPHRGIYVGSLDGARPKRLVVEPSSAMYIKPGYLVYASDTRALVARRFDLAREEVSEEVIPIADRVWYNEGTGRAVFSASHTGLIAYREPLVSRLQWISRTGATLSASREGTYHSFAVASDHRTLASQLDPVVGRYDLWLYDAKWAPRRLTFDPFSDLRPVWSADESAAVFSRQERGGSQLYEVKIDRPGLERPLLPRPSPGGIGAVSWNGDVLEYATFGHGEPSRLWSFRPGSADQPRLIDEGRPNETQASLSPDKRWVAFTANVTDSRVPNTAVFVRPWPNDAGRSQIAEAGSVPRWRRDGKELFFIAPGGRLLSQPVTAGRAAGMPIPLCATDALATSGLAGQAYDAVPDGDRFLVKVPARPAPIIIVSRIW